MTDSSAAAGSFDDWDAAVPDPETAWCTITGRNGYAVRTNAYDDVPAGSLFVAVLAPDGTEAGHWLTPTWAHPGTAAATMAALWRAASAGETRYVDGYGPELVFSLPHGAVHACPDGGYVRLVDADGNEVDDGSAHWDVLEWQCDPELVMGALLGGARALT